MRDLSALTRLDELRIAARVLGGRFPEDLLDELRRLETGPVQVLATPLPTSADEPEPPPPPDEPLESSPPEEPSAPRAGWLPALLTLENVIFLLGAVTTVGGALYTAASTWSAATDAVRFGLVEGALLLVGTLCLLLGWRFGRHTALQSAARPLTLTTGAVAALLTAASGLALSTSAGVGAAGLVAASALGLWTAHRLAIPTPWRFPVALVAAAVPAALPAAVAPFALAVAAALSIPAHSGSRPIQLAILAMVAAAAAIVSDQAGVSPSAAALPLAVLVWAAAPAVRPLESLVALTAAGSSLLLAWGHPLVLLAVLPITSAAFWSLGRAAATDRRLRAGFLAASSALALCGFPSVFDLLPVALRADLGAGSGTLPPVWYAASALPGVALLWWFAGLRGEDPRAPWLRDAAYLAATCVAGLVVASAFDAPVAAACVAWLTLAALLPRRREHSDRAAAALAVAAILAVGLTAAAFGSEPWTLAGFVAALVGMLAGPAPFRRVGPWVGPTLLAATAVVLVFEPTLPAWTAGAMALAWAGGAAIASRRGRPALARVVVPALMAAGLLAGALPVGGPGLLEPSWWPLVAVVPLAAAGLVIRALGSPRPLADQVAALGMLLWASSMAALAPDLALAPWPLLAAAALGAIAAAVVFAGRLPEIPGAWPTHRAGVALLVVTALAAIWIEPELSWLGPPVLAVAGAWLLAARRLFAPRAADELGWSGLALAAAWAGWNAAGAAGVALALSGLALVQRALARAGGALAAILALGAAGAAAWLAPYGSPDGTLVAAWLLAGVAGVAIATGPRQAAGVLVLELAVGGLFATLRYKTPALAALQGYDAVVLAAAALGLVGVSALLRRRPGTEAARRVTEGTGAALPLLVPGLLQWTGGPGETAALLVGGLVHVALARMSSRVVHGWIAAALVYAATLPWWLASGVGTSWPPIALGGAALLVLTHVYRDRLPAEGTLRTLGTVAALGAGAVEVLAVASPGPALALAALSVVAALAGVLFRFRAYAILGLTFLVIDIVVNLTRWGIADRTAAGAIGVTAGVALFALGAAVARRKQAVASIVRQVNRWPW